MGHCIDYRVVERKEDIWAAAYSFAEANVDRMENPGGSYHGRLTIHDNKICDSYEEAEEFIDRMDNGFYDDHAVRFKSYKHIKKPKYLTDKIERLSELRKELKDMQTTYHFEEHKAKFIGCKSCGSKINNEIYMRKNRPNLNYCPICGEDLRPQSTLDRVEKKKEAISNLEKSIKKDEKKFEEKQKSQAEIFWLVKLEVHC